MSNSILNIQEKNDHFNSEKQTNEPSMFEHSFESRENSFQTICKLHLKSIDYQALR